MRAPTLLFVATTAACAAAPDSTVFAPTAERCRTKGCNWVLEKAARLQQCQTQVTDDVVRGAECMGPYIEYFGTKTCKNTRAWLSRLRAGIPEGE